MSCGNEKTAGSTGSGDVDITTDPASSSIFAVDSKRYAYLCLCRVLQ